MSYPEKADPITEIAPKHSEAALSSSRSAMSKTHITPSTFKKDDRVLFHVIVSDHEEYMSNAIVKSVTDAQIGITLTATKDVSISGGRNVPLPFTDKRYLEKLKNFEVGDTVIAHWLNKDKTERASCKAKIIKIEDTQVTIQTLESVSLDGVKYSRGRFLFFGDVDSNYLSYLDEETHPILEAETPYIFNVGDTVDFHWRDSSDKFHGDSIIIKIVPHQYTIKLLKDVGYFKKGHEIDVPRPFDYYSENIIGKHPVITDFKVDEIVLAHWNLSGKYYQHDIKITEIKDNEIFFVLTNMDKSFILDGHEYRTDDASIFGFNLPFNYPKHYITHKTTPHTFSLGEIVTAHWAGGVIAEATIVAIDKYFIKVSLHKDTIIDGIEHLRGEFFTFALPFTKLNYLSKETHLKVDEIATGHWIVDGKEYTTKIRILNITPYNIEFINVSKLVTSEETDDIGTEYNFLYPFSYSHFITKLTPASTVPPFSLGEVVTAYFNGKKAKAKIKEIIKRDRYFVIGSNLLEDVGSPHIKGYDMRIDYPFNDRYYYEKISSRTPFNLTTFNKKLFERYKKTISSESFPSVEYRKGQVWALALNPEWDLVLFSIGKLDVTNHLLVKIGGKGKILKAKGDNVVAVRYENLKRPDYILKGIYPTLKEDLKMV